MKIRFASEKDSTALLQIYEQYIHTPITFEYVLPTAEEFGARIKNIIQDYPYLVWEEEGRPAGYAYAHRQMERAAYQWNAELSVYVDRDYLSRGIGRSLYEKLMEILRLQGVRNVYGVVTLPNEKSEGLHRSLGFQLLGIHRGTGYKCGRWHDVGWFGKQILAQDGEPAPFLPFSQLERSELLNK